ncbi:hypothetical protein HHK36_014735 [Tetracentron sinense]|uniref:ENTH domain-containing protein n=1 Tax=Tetracentron sinense TaxID=13715 RepID=A0A834Z7Y6_TETSI|nr:hypothetical protein HHK36_014735 [Tetracentron sinense]
MRLWRRASGVFKDKNSICIAKLSRRTPERNPDLESAIIKATSHNESSLDYKNVQRVFAWVRTSPAYIKPLVWALSKRIEKTRSWVVALKGLMLMHGVFCCKIPAARMIGRLPFDLSNFNDGYSKPSKTWGYSAFVRVYFAFLDYRSVFLSGDSQDGKDEPMVQVLLMLQQLQGLLDMLLQIRPRGDGMKVGLIREAMDCVVIEIYDVYSRICNGIAGVLVGIYAAGKAEAVMALGVLQKAASQGEDITSYFELCREIGVLNASEFPRIEKIPEEDIRDLEQIIKGVSEKKNMGVLKEDKAIIEVKDSRLIEQQNPKSFLKTIVTDNWVVFDDNIHEIKERGEFSGVEKRNETDPFAASVNVPPLIYGYNDRFPNSNGLLQLEQYSNFIQGASSVAENHRNLMYTRDEEVGFELWEMDMEFKMR